MPKLVVGWFVIFVFRVVVCQDPTQCCDEEPKQICGLKPVGDQYAPRSCKYYETISGVSCFVREYFMKQTLTYAMNYTGSLCPSDMFSALVVNHTNGGTINDEIICRGINQGSSRGALYHGEMVALENCYNTVIERYGVENLNNPALWQQLSLYTTGESCPMCMSAIRWTKMGEVIYATSIKSLGEFGFGQIYIDNEFVQSSSSSCQFGGGSTSYQTRVITDVLKDTIDPYFEWITNANAPCPPPCSRVNGSCVPPLA